MAAVPLKAHYRPTLAELLSPRWRRCTRAVRLLVVALVLALVVAVASLVLALLPARISYGGPVPFSFSYRGLYRTAPHPGEDVKVQRLDARGRLADSFTVRPLLLPPYQGELSGELPLYASSYIHALATRLPGLRLLGEGKARIAATLGYNIYYTALIAGRTMYGRDLLLVPEHPLARGGLIIAMLTAPHSDREVTSPQTVATAGPLYMPLRTFSFG